MAPIKIKLPVYRNGHTNIMQAFRLSAQIRRYN